MKIKISSTRFAIIYSIVFVVIYSLLTFVLKKALINLFLFLNLNFTGFQTSMFSMTYNIFLYIILSKYILLFFNKYYLYENKRKVLRYATLYYFSFLFLFFIGISLRLGAIPYFLFQPVLLLLFLFSAMFETFLFYFSSKRYLYSQTSPQVEKKV